MMIKRINVLALLVLAFLSSSDFGQEPKAVTKVHLRGVVTIERNGERLDHARIVIIGNDFSETVISNSTGEWESDVPPGEYTITISAPGFRVLSLSPVKVSAPGVELKSSIKLGIASDDCDHCLELTTDPIVPKIMEEKALESAALVTKGKPLSRKARNRRRSRQRSGCVKSR